MIRNVVFFYPQRDDPRKICSCRSFRFFSFDRFSLSIRVRYTSEKLELLFFIEHSAPVLHSHTYTHTHTSGILKRRKERMERKVERIGNDKMNEDGHWENFLHSLRSDGIYIYEEKNWKQNEMNARTIVGKKVRTRYEIMKYWRKRGKNGKNGKLRDKRENNCWKKLYVRCKISVHFLVKKDLILLF